MAGEELVAINCQVAPTVLAELFMRKTPLTVVQAIPGATQVVA
jgi:hypothetical protein